MRVHVRRTSWHTVQAQHRALATIGKLAAEHSKHETLADGPSSKSAVRVVRGDGSDPVPGTPPALRSRPRRSSASGPTETKEPEPPGYSNGIPPPANGVRNGQVLPGPSVKIVRGQILQPLPTEVSRPGPAVPRPVLPVIPSMRPNGLSTEVIRFDALADQAPRKPEVTKATAARPRAPTVAGRQLRNAVGRGNAAATRAVRAGGPAFAVVLARTRLLASSVVAAVRAALTRLSAQPRALTGAAAGLLVLVAIACLAAAAGGGGSVRHPLARHPSAAHQAPASPAVQLPSAAQSGVAQQGAQLPAALLEMTSSTSAVYQVGGPISVVLDASGPCWIEARRSGPTGGLLFEGTLVPGQTWTVAGPTWLRLGNPTVVSLTVNGALVSPPATDGIPFDLQIG
jgi:hypothetical protein